MSENYNHCAVDSPFAIEVAHLTRRFVSKRKPDGLTGWRKLFARSVEDSFTAVSDLSFTVEKGERVAFIGKNGAGKSTTLKMLCGLLCPSEGSGKVCGIVPWDNPRKLARKIGVVFGQKSHLWQSLPVRDSFELLGKIYDVPTDEYKSRYGKLVELFGLRKFMEQNAATLSLGQRMRCDIAASLLHQPELLFLDEPTIGLDATAKVLLRDHLDLMAREFATTIILTSHDTEDIESICRRAIVMDRGAIMLDATLPELRSRYAASKALRLSTLEESPEFSREGVSVAERMSHGLVLSVDTGIVAVGAVVAECLSKFEVTDIAVESMPLDAILRDLYAEAKRRR